MNEQVEQGLAELNARIDRHIASFSGKVKRDKSKAYRFKFIALILTLTATLALGVEWAEQWSEMTKNIAFACSAAVTFFTGLDLYYNHRALWVQYTKTRNLLYQIKDDLSFKLATTAPERLSVDDLNMFHQRIQACLGDCNTWWVKERSNGTS